MVCLEDDLDKGALEDSVASATELLLGLVKLDEKGVCASCCSASQQQVRNLNNKSSATKKMDNAVLKEMANAVLAKKMAYAVSYRKMANTVSQTD